MSVFNRLRSRWLALVHDLLTVPAAWFGAYLLRFNFETIPDEVFRQALLVLPILVVVQGGSFLFFRLYRGVWRFSSVPDLVRIVKAVVVGILLSVLAIFLLIRLQHIPRSIFPLYGLLLLALLTGPRVLYRWLSDYRFYYRAGQRVLIVGAGRAGEMLVRDLLRDTEHTYQPVAFVDDDRNKWSKEIHGVRVAGGCGEIPKLAETLAMDVIMLAVPSAGSQQMRRLVELCEATGLPVRTLPRIHDLVSGKASLNALREVSIEDLLGRESVSLDWEAMRHGLGGRRILVSGGGGSIGSELCRQLARLKPASLTVLENSEFNLYQIERELRQNFPDLTLKPRLGDVTDEAAVEHVMREDRPEVVFHAAAYKHVPMLERDLREGVRNNVLGTAVMARAADKHRCDGFVLISTDKAVNPANVLGATKRAAEIYCQNLDRHSATTYITVRFGNVLDSAGSVVPLFRKQIEAGGPVTVTHPDVTRYFMTIPEACQLIMEAAVIGEGGEIFVLSMGEPVKISYLADQMIRLAGKVPGEDIEVVYTGLRPGEKLHEELFHEQESLKATGHDKILLANFREVDWESLNATLKELQQACSDYDDEALRELMARLVPEFITQKAEELPMQAIPYQEVRG